jgi:uncharacterized membrane protein
MAPVSQNAEYDLCNEAGKAALLALIGIASLGLYYAFASQYILGSYGELVHMSIVSVLGVIFVFATAGRLHLDAVGYRSSKDLRAEVVEEAKELAKFLSRYMEEVQECERTINRFDVALSRSSRDQLSVLRRVVSGLQMRFHEVNELLSTGKSLDVMLAQELLQKDLSMNGDSLSLVLDREPLPPLPPGYWEPTVESNLRAIQRELMPLRNVA